MQHRVDFTYPKKVFMKNLPADTVSKSQRIRANAVWLMNAASLAVAIGAINNVAKSKPGSATPLLVPYANATDYYYAGSSVPSDFKNYIAWWTGAFKANNTAADVISSVGSGAGTLAYGNVTDNFYFGSSTALASGQSFYNTINLGSSNIAAISFNFVSGSSNYTFTNTNTKVLQLGSNTSAAGATTVGLMNNSTSAIVFNTPVRTKGGATSSSATIFAQNTTTGSLVFNGSTTTSSYIINPYAYDWAVSTGSTAAQARTFGASQSAGGTAIAIADANSGVRFATLTGSGAISVTGAINDAWRGNAGTTTSPFTSNGTGNLVITNTGATTLSGWNTYTGTTTIGDGTAAGGTVVIGNRYAFGGNRQTDTTSPNWTGTSSGYTGLAYYVGGSSAFSAGDITATTASGFKNATQAYGVVTVNSGFTVDLNGTAMLGQNAITINGSGAAGAGVFKNSNTAAATYAGAVTLASDSTITSGTGAITFSSSFAASAFTTNFNGASNTTLNGALTGSGTINKSGAGTLTLAGAGNTYTGALNIEQGAVTFGSTNSAGFSASTAALTFGASNTPTLSLAGKNLTRGNISSTNTGAILENASASAATLTSSAAGNTTFAGIIRDGSGAGALSFTKAGLGALTLTGANTYTGATTINGGTLNINGSISASSAVTVNSGATLSGLASTGNLTLGTTTLNGGGALNIQIADFGGTAGTGWDLLTTGSLSIGATSLNKFTLYLNTLSSSSPITAGDAVFNKANNYSLKIISSSSLTGFGTDIWNINTSGVTNAVSGVWDISNTGNDIYLNYTALSAQYWNGAAGWDSSSTAGGAGTWTNGSGSYDSTFTVNFGGTAGTVTVDNATTTKLIKFTTDGYTLTGGTLTMNGANSANNTIDVGTGLTSTINSKIVSSSVVVNKSGLGTLVLGADNSNSGIAGGLSVTNGVLKITNAGALGASNSAVTVLPGATLDLNGQNVTNTNALTITGTGAASTGGALVNSSSTDASYAGLVTLGGATTINASSGAISLTNTGTITGSGFNLTVNGAYDTTISSVIGTGTGTVTKSGNGTLTFGGANTFTGNISVAGGRLKLGNNSALGTSSSPAVTISSGATLDLNGKTVSNANTLSLIGTGAGSYGGALVNTSTTDSAYSGLITLAGATTINASNGNITLSNPGTITGATFGLTVTGNSNVSIASIIGTTTGSITKNGAGTLTLSGANTYTGGTNVTAGNLKVGSASALGASASSVTVAAGATLDLNGQTITNTNVLNLSGTGALSSGGALINSSTTAVSYSGQLALNANATVNALNGDITFASNSNLNGRTFQLTVDGAYNTTINSTNPSNTSQYMTFVKKGTGTLFLNSYNNSSTDAAGAGLTTLTVNAGIVKIGHTQALGGNGNNPFGTTWSGYGASVVINNGGTLDLNGIQYNKTPIVVLSGTGAAGTGGALTNSSATAAKMQGVYLLADNTTISSGNGGGLNISANSSNVYFFNIRNKTLTLDGSDTSLNSTVSTAIIGTGSVVKTGTGTWTLNPNNAGNNTVNYYYLDYDSNTSTYSTVAAPSTAASNFFSGNLNINQGTLRLGNNNALGSTSASISVAGVTVASGASLDMFGRTILVTPTLSLSGTGAAGAGGALFNSGAITATYSGSVSLAGDTTINASGANITLANIGAITGNGRTLTIDGAFNTSIASVLGTGAGGLIKNGTGTLTLSGANTLTGNIAINAGRVQLGNVNALGTSTVPSITIASGATLDLNGIAAATSNSVTINGTGAGSYGGALVNSAAGVAASFAGDITLASDTTISASAGTISLSGVISGNYNLNIAGGLTTRWTRFTGTSANTFGSLTLSGYDLGFTDVNQLSSGTITAASVNARIIYGASSAPAATSASMTIANALNTGSNNTQVLAVAPNDASNTINLTGKISGSGKLKVSAGGTLVLANSANDFTGGIEIGTGNISISNSGQLGSGTINFGTTSSSGLNITDDMTVTNGVTMSGSAYIANIDVSSAKVAEFTGTLSPTSTGGKLNKTGAGTLTLSNVNTFTGVTTVTAGTLNLKNLGSIASSGVTVSTGATLKATNSSMPASAVTGAITLNSGALVDLTEGSLKATSLTVAALSGSDVTKISYTIGNSFALTGGLTLNGALTIDFTTAITGVGVYDVLTWGGSRSGLGSISFVNHSTADWVMSGVETSGKYTINVVSAFISGSSFSGSGTVTVPSGATVGDISGSVTVSAAATTTVGAISGGTVNLSGTNNTVGAISGGTVNLNASGSTVAELATGGALNVKANSTITTLTGGTLSVDSGTDAAVASGTSTATITGAGNLVKTGNGKLVLSGTSSDYTGATKVAGGELEVTNVAALGATSGISLGTASNGTAATLNYSGGDVTLNKDITALSTSQAGNTLQNSGSGLLTLTGNLTKNGTVLTLKGDMKVDGHIVGENAGSDLVISSGTTTITSSNSYNGPTFIESGAKLIANNASATGDGVVNVANGATLQVGDASHMLTLTTGGFALTNGAHIKIYIDQLSTANISTTHIDPTGATVYDQSSFAGTNYSSLATAGLLDLSALTAGQGVTIDLYSTAGDNSAVAGLVKTALYDLKFLSFGSLSSGVTEENISSFFTINYNHLRDANGDALYADTRIKVYLDKHLDGSGTIMMTIPEPSTYGLGLGALALAVAAIRRRKQKKATA